MRYAVKLKGARRRHRIGKRFSQPVRKRKRRGERRRAVSIERKEGGKKRDVAPASQAQEKEAILKGRGKRRSAVGVDGCYGGRSRPWAIRSFVFKKGQANMLLSG